MENLTQSATTRITIDNKKLTYRLRVLQQPLRARACGSGAKSSADRRPVDPPPIVELKIFEGEPNHEEDITFKMNANYFLFATLEPARPIAQGRVSEDKNRACVLTGAPVSGMVYLDRPAPAGYFIFPDLSVRHEGKYRLSFSLYEELKNSRDFDKTENGQVLFNSGEAHVTHRLEVKSSSFVVYSAKKFPGLTESTSLSRMVAEQGCRVRIRRDVRMRKRETKPGKDWDDYEEDTAAARATMSATPDNTPYGSSGFMDTASRPRSASNTSLHSIATNIPRRSSSNDIGSQYPASQYNGPPRTPQSTLISASPYICTPTQHYNQNTTFAPQSTTMQPPPPVYPQPHQHQHQHQNYSNTPIAVDTTPSTGNFYSYPSPANNIHQPQHFVAPASTAHELQPSPNRLNPEYPGSVHQNHSHTPVTQYTGLVGAPLSNLPQQPQEGSVYTIVPGQHYQNQQSSGTQSYVAHRQQQQHNLQDTSTRVQADSNHMLSMKLNNRIDKQLPPLQIHDPNSPLTPSHMDNFYPPPELNHKRSFGTVFDDRHLAQPLRDGARPNISYNGDTGITNADSECPTDDAESTNHSDLHLPTMRYRRADGSSIVRALPPHGYDN